MMTLTQGLYSVRYKLVDGSFCILLCSVNHPDRNLKRVSLKNFSSVSAFYDLPTKYQDSSSSHENS